MLLLQVFNIDSKDTSGTPKITIPFRGDQEKYIASTAVGTVSGNKGLLVGFSQTQALHFLDFNNQDKDSNLREINHFGFNGTDLMNAFG